MSFRPYCGTKSGRKAAAILLFFVGLVLFSLPIANHLGLVYPPEISTSFQAWFSSLLLGIALMGSGIYLWTR